ncbi:Smr domain-containing protein [Shigella sonnei]|nr:Smr domain-containing protein [Shigella sonnei]
MNLDDKSLFLDAMEDVQPLKRATDVHWHPTRNQRAPQRIDTLQLDNFLTTGFLDIIPLSQPLEFRREGLLFTLNSEDFDNIVLVLQIGEVFRQFFL